MISKKYEPGYRMAARQLIGTALALFGAEFLFMLLLPRLGIESVLTEALIDALGLLLIVFLINYFLLYRPLTRSLKEQARVEELLHDFAEVASDWYWEMDENFRFNFISSNLEINMGESQKALIGRTRWDVASDRGEVGKWEEHQKHLESHKPFRNFEYQSKDATGQAIWFRTSGKPLFDENGTFKGYRGVGSDCTTEKMAHDALNRSNSILSGIMDRSLIGFMVLESVHNREGAISDFKISYINRKSLVYFGGKRENYLGKLVRMQLSRIVDQELFDEALKTTDTGTTFDIEKKFPVENPRPDSPPYIYFRILGVKLEDGLVVSFANITRRKIADREKALAKAVFETSAEAMMVTNAENEIISVNPAFTEITGYSAEEAIGKNPGFLGSGRHNKAFFRTMWNELEKNDHWVGDIWNRRKDGNIWVSRATVSVIRDKKTGKHTNYIEVFSDITREKEQSEEAFHRANHDALTGLPNRSLLSDRVHSAIERAKRKNQTFSLLFLDLNKFKPVNDSHGHVVGDQLLQNVAERLQISVRKSDTVARIGGDEFVILCLDTSHESDALTISETICKSLETPFRIQDLEITIGTSIGISTYPTHGNDFETLSKAADEAMYRAKKAGQAIAIADETETT